MKKVLVTGGAGYVGSHCCKAFAAAGWDVTVFDNFSRGHREAVLWGPAIDGDLLDPAALDRALGEVRPDLVAHFAALTYVGESVEDPGLYYRTNALGTLNLVDAMGRAGVGHLIFSSSCATYGEPDRPTLDEGHRQWPISPYGWSKLVVERILADCAVAHRLASVSLRYFNAAGGDLDGRIGEWHDPETHLIPLAIDAALSGDELAVNGTSFATPDGSAVRDFIHVEDLGDAHVRAADYCLAQPGAHAFNLGTGTGTSVRQIIAEVERQTGRTIAQRPGPPRAGDPAALVAAPDLARRTLGWTPRHSDIATIIRTAIATRPA